MPDDPKAESEAQGNDPSPQPEAEETDPHDFDEPEQLVDHRILDGEPEDEGDSDDDEPEWPEDLLDRAERLGLEEDEAKEFGDPAKLKKVLDRLEKSEAARKQAEPPKLPKQQPKAEPAEDAGKFKVKLPADLFDPELIDVVNGLNDHVSGQLSSMRKDLDTIKSFLEKRQAAESQAVFDQMVEGLGAEWSDHFGQGPTAALSNRSKAAKNRRLLNEEIKLLEAGYEATGKAAPVQGDLFNRALRGAFPDQFKLIAEGKTRRRAAKRQTQFVGRPGAFNGNAADADPTRRAVQNVARLMRDKGIGQYSSPDEF